MTARRSQFCTGGHDRTAPGALYPNGQCRACKREYNQARARQEREEGSAKRGSDAVSRTDRLLALWKQLETAMPFDRPSIHNSIRELTSAQ
jgi:predicted dithiol-disulfide oxidoreductase (DUF899 family)